MKTFSAGWQKGRVAWQELHWLQAEGVNDFTTLEISHNGDCSSLDLICFNVTDNLIVQFKRHWEGAWGWCPEQWEAVGRKGALSSRRERRRCVRTCTAEVSRAVGAQAAQQGSLCREQTASAESSPGLFAQRMALCSHHMSKQGSTTVLFNHLTKGLFFSSADTHLGAAI